MKVKPTLPHVDCNYRIALLVNDTIENEEACRRHKFENEFNKELHSLDQTICVNKYDKYENPYLSEADCQVIFYFIHHVSVNILINNNFFFLSRKMMCILNMYIRVVMVFVLLLMDLITLFDQKNIFELIINELTLKNHYTAVITIIGKILMIGIFNCKVFFQIILMHDCKNLFSLFSVDFY